MKEKEDLGDELCKYCSIIPKGVYAVDGGFVAGCEGSQCSGAYDNYLEQCGTKTQGNKNVCGTCYKYESCSVIAEPYDTICQLYKPRQMNTCITIHEGGEYQMSSGIRFNRNFCNHCPCEVCIKQGVLSEKELSKIRDRAYKILTRK